MVRWRRGISRPCPASHGHGTATPGVHMEITVKFSVALPCVKSPVSRTREAIFDMSRVENVSGRTSLKGDVDSQSKRYE